MNSGTQKQTEDQGIDYSPESGEQTSAESQYNQTNSEIDKEDYYVELKYRNVESVGTAKLAKGLGFFSIALGLAEVLAPSKVAGLIGVGERHQAFLPVLGLREIAHGVGILYQDKPTESVMTRIAGDAVDLAFLGSAFMSEETNKTRLTGATIAVLGVAALDVFCAQQLNRQNWADSQGNLEAPTTVGQPSARHAADA